MEAVKAEERHAKAIAGKEPPMMQGDTFSSLFEGVSEFVLESCENSNVDPVGKCKVKLTYDPKGRAVLWRVGYIEYGGTWAFGNKGKLSDSLKAVIAEIPAK